MRGRRGMIPGVWFCMLVFASSAGWCGASDAEQQVRAAEAARVAALDGSDIAALERILGDDLTYVHASGRVDTKASLLAAVQSGELHYMAWTPKKLNVRVVGPAMAVIDGEYNVRVTDDRKHEDPLVVNVFFLGVYALRKGSWQQIAWQSTRRP